MAREISLWVFHDLGERLLKRRKKHYWNKFDHTRTNREVAERATSSTRKSKKQEKLK